MGKSLIATRIAEDFKGAYFYCHNDDARNYFRFLLGTIASQLPQWINEYSSLMGGCYRELIPTLLDNELRSPCGIVTSLLTWAKTLAQHPEPYSGLWPKKKI